MACSSFDDAVHRRRRCHQPQQSALNLLDAYTVDRSKATGVDRARERDFDVAERTLPKRVDGVNIDELAFADNRDAVGDTLNFVK
jgi:hypothetical protein